jgi:DNA-binding transcriptional LysR family regulator
MIELRSLKAFLAVAESGSMTLAARRLGMTQPAVSQIVRQLERRFEVELVDRASRPLQLTSAGVLLRNRAGRILDDAEQLAPLLRDQADAKLHEIKLGLVDSFATTAGPQLVRRLSDEAARVLIWSGLSPSLGSGLVNRSLDLVVTTDAMEDLDGFERHALMSEPFVLLLPRSAAAAVRSAALDRLARDMPLVRYSARSHIGSQIERHLRRVRAEAPRHLEVDGSDTLVAMVAAGLGWAVTTPLCLLQGKAYAGGVRAVRLPGPGFVRQLTLVARHGLHPDLPPRVAERARTVLQGCLAEIRKLVPWLSAEIAIA